MRRGEIHWYKFDPPDKKRPVLILHRTEVIEFLSEITVAPITTRVRDLPSEVYLPASAAKVPRDSVVNLDHIATVSKSKIGELIATLDESQMRQVNQAIRFALGF
jgi:mRNA interferase MazF